MSACFSEGCGSLCGHGLKMIGRAASHNGRKCISIGQPAGLKGWDCRISGFAVLLWGGVGAGVFALLLLA